MELETTDFTDYTVKKMYIYNNAEILAEHDGAYNADEYYYLHDRLGSVRQIINSSGSVVKLYTYSPFGETLEEQGSVDNDFKFAGQYYDKEIGQYYLRARQYSPYLARFTGRDLIIGSFDDPMSLHKYLYCKNDPINMIDPMGRWYWFIHHDMIDAAFPELSTVERKYIDYGSQYVDTFQSTENSFMHAMRGPKESVGHAENAMQNFVRQHFQNYQVDLFLGEAFGDDELIADAYFQLGMAMHPVMDSTDPLHKDFQIWYGMKDPRSLQHENFEPYGASKATMQKTKEMMHYVMDHGEPWGSWGG